MDDSQIFDIENVIAEFEFILAFDPTYTKTGKKIAINQTIALDKQKITVTDIEIYPSHIRINVKDDPDNTAWLRDLNYQIIIDGTEVFNPVQNGISATGSEDSKSMASFRSDSSYFYEAEQLSVRVPFLKAGHYHQALIQSFYHSEEKEYFSCEFSTDGPFIDDAANEKYFVQHMELTDYHDKEIWIDLDYSYQWTPEEPVRINLDVK